MARGLPLVALAALIWGTTGTTLELIGATSATDALLVGAIRMVVAAPLLLAVLFAKRERPKVGGWAFVVAGVCMAAYQVCYFSAVPLAGVAATALLAICSAPILVAVLAYLLLGEVLTGTRVLALVLGVGGAGLLLVGTGAQVEANFGLGALLALGAGLTYSLYAVVTKRSLGERQPLTLSALTFGVAGLALAPLLGWRWTETVALIGRGGLQLLYLGAIATAGAYWLYASALRTTPAGAVVVVGLLEPLVATLLGVFLFHERLGPAGIAGGVLLVVAVLLLGWIPSGGTSTASAGRIRACSE
ncbi:MAG: DMT family transporter [Chloroflexota bacterium]